MKFLVALLIASLFVDKDDLEFSFIPRHHLYPDDSYSTGVRSQKYISSILCVIPWASYPFSVCRSGHKGHDDLTLFSSSSDLSPTVCSGFQTQSWQLNTRIMLVARLNPKSYDTSSRKSCISSIRVPEGTHLFQEHSQHVKPP